MEIWKDIQGYENLYQVSNTGKIKGLPRIDSNGRMYPERFLTPNYISNAIHNRSRMVKGKEYIIKTAFGYYWKFL